MSFKRTHISFNSQKSIVGSLCLLLLVIETINFFTARSLNAYGLVPRDYSSLAGIIASPFLHGSLPHFFSNIVPFTIFSFLMLQHGVGRFWLISMWIIVIGGTGVWFFGRSAIHVGASGLIYGYFGYLVLAGIFSRELKLILISVVVGLGYGGMIFGILPGMPFVSWEGHLFGFIAGLVAAFLWGRVKLR